MSLSPLATFYHQAQDVSVDFQNNRYVITSDRKDAMEAIRTGQEAMGSLLMGISAVGTLISRLDHEDKGIDPLKMDRAGHLVESLADLAFAMNENLALFNCALEAS